MKNPNSFGFHKQTTIVAPAYSWAALLCIMGVAVPAFGEEQPSAADTAAARDLAIEGIKLADTDHCASAIDKLVRAEKLRHSAIVLGRLGECRIQVGKVVDGTEDLQRMLHEAVPANPPANLVKARERAQAALEAAKPDLAYLAVSVKGATENLSVSIDGQPMPTVLLDRERPTDPGEHLVEAVAPGYNKAFRRLTIAAGEKQEVTLKLVANPQAPPQPVPEVQPATTESPAKTALEPAHAPQQRPVPEPAQAPPPSSSNTTSYVLLGAGGAAVLAGGIFGILAINEKGKLDCPGNTCPAGSKGTLDSADKYATVSTVLVGGGAAVALLGTVFLLAGDSSPSQEKPPSQGLTAHAAIGLGSASVFGTF